MTVMPYSLKRVYWESTAGCNLRCIHCRRLDVLDQESPDQLTTEEAKRFMLDLAGMGKPVFIFSGGEPLVRKDFFELAEYGRTLGLPLALATNGTLVDGVAAARIRSAGIYYASVSFDGATADTHEIFRGPGTFQKTINGMKALQGAGVKVQINFTVTKKNVHEVPAVYQMAKENNAIALYLFLLVPVGCGVQIADSQMLSPAEVEEWLHWVYQKEQERALPVKAICAPHYFRVAHEIKEPHEPVEQDRKGCLAGIHMCFVSHTGDVYPCGYLPTTAGNLRKQDIGTIWRESPSFAALRDPDLLKGRCGVCDFKAVCGGCRARGFFATGDVLSEEPFCQFDPVLVEGR